MNALVGLLRARSREAMQLAVLQLHSSVANSALGPGIGAMSAHPSPGGASGMDVALSPMALSALLTPSGTGYRWGGDAMPLLQPGAPPTPLLLARLTPPLPELRPCRSLAQLKPF
jgi:hypothetical protein